MTPHCNHQSHEHHRQAAHHKRRPPLRVRKHRERGNGQEKARGHHQESGVFHALRLGAGGASEMMERIPLSESATFVPHNENELKTVITSL